MEKVNCDFWNKTLERNMIKIGTALYRAFSAHEQNLRTNQNVPLCPVVLCISAPKSRSSFRLCFLENQKRSMCFVLIDNTFFVCGSNFRSHSCQRNRENKLAITIWMSIIKTANRERRPRTLLHVSPITRKSFKFQISMSLK